jgi:hypothetical protein
VGASDDAQQIDAEEMGKAVPVRRASQTFSISEKQKERVGMVGMRGPKWSRGEVEKPTGARDMGGWTASVFTSEQQSRLNIDAFGAPMVPSPSISKLISQYSSPAPPTQPTVLLTTPEKRCTRHACCKAKATCILDL